MPKRHVHTPSPARDWRLTSQRLDILEYLRRQSGHLTAERVYRGVKKKLPSISFGTVYRNLDFLRQHGYVKEFVVDKVSRYESRVDSHVHLVCENCFRIYEMDDKRLSRLTKALAAAGNFFMRSDNLEIRGYCRDCQKKLSPKLKTPELFCLACGELLDDLRKEAPVCQNCCFQTDCKYYTPTTGNKVPSK